MKIKRLVSVLTALAIVLTAALASSCGKKDDPVNTDSDWTVEGTPSVWSENFTVSEPMMTYFFNSYYRSFINNYQNYLSYLGLDTSKKLADQQYSEDYTWYAYIMLQVYGQLQQTLALAEAAKAEGFALDDDDTATVDNSITQYSESATGNGYALDGYLAALFGEGVNESAVRSSMKLQLLASKYYEELTGKYDYSDDDCQKYFDENAQQYVYFDYIRAAVSADDAETLSACKDEDSFVAALSGIIARDSYGGDYEGHADTIDELVSAKYTRRVAYNESSDFIVWAFDSARAPYDIFTKDEDDGTVSVCMMLPATGDGAYSSLLYRDMNPVHNIKYMLFTESEYGSADAAKTKADSVFAKWKESANEDNFDTLSQQYGGSTSNDIEKGELARVLENWIFDDTRATGDTTEITISGTGTYILYMLDDGDISWIYETRAQLEKDKFNEDIEDLQKQYPSEYDGDIVYNTPEIAISGSAA